MDVFDPSTAATNYTFESIEVARNKSHSEIVNFFENNESIIEKVRTNIENDVPRLVLPLSIMDEVSTDFAKQIIMEPSVYIPAVDEAVQDIYQRVSQTSNYKHAKIGFAGWIRGHTITPRGLRAHLLNSLVAVEGIVTRCSVSKPKLVRTVHLAESSGSFLTREYNDQCAIGRHTGGSSNGLIPARDPEGNAYKIEIGMSEFRDFQKIVIQEMPENAPTGQLPCSIEVILEGDLVDSCKAGDRVSIFGVYRSVPRKENGILTGTTSSFVIGNNVVHLVGSICRIDLVPEDIRLIRKISVMKDVLTHMAQSVAPGLCGGLEKKKGLLLQLLGGSHKSLENSTVNIRGDIHILLIGDPSCGKSQMLRFMMNASPLALSTTGRGSSGVGLTAAVTVDKDSGERRLEAGAMVMADMGLVCIDEFDKMTHEDRVAIHEVMEQQRVSISKASIQCTLNARCSVLAAANPAYGCFETNTDIKSQISFPDSLMSRFDLIFLVHDTQTPQEDRKICRTVIQHHSVTTSNALQMQDRSKCNGEVDRNNWTVQPRADPNEGRTNFSKGFADGSTVYSIDFLKKYIMFARRCNPVLSEEAIESISDFYTDLRGICHNKSRGAQRFAVPTARTLEACIRLSTAHAKLRLSEVVQLEDVYEAKRLLTFTLIGEYLEDVEAPAKPNRKKATLTASKRAAAPLTIENGEGDVMESRPKQPNNSKSVSGNVPLVPSVDLIREVNSKCVDLKEQGTCNIQKEFLYTRLSSSMVELTPDMFDVILKEMIKKGSIMDLNGELWLV